MKQLPGPGDTNMCPGCRSLSCTCGPRPMKESEIPNYDTELEYAVERFEDENGRWATSEELTAIKAECREKVDSAKEAYADWKATGGFICDVCDGVHYHWAPKACRDAHNSEHF